MGSVRSRLAVSSRLAIAGTTLILLGAAVPGGTTSAAAAIDPSASAFLAGALKPAMQSTLKKQVPGLVITKVTCFVPTTSAVIAGKCTAKFKLAKYNLLGVYQAKAKLDNKSRLSWSTSARSCTDSRTRQRASCTGESSTGGGLISARDAEAQLLRSGFIVRNAKKSAKSAVCTGLKSKKWKHGEFDDVFKQLRCDVKAADGTYRLVFVMVNAGNYRLTSVAKRA
jgi:hypothetical protein